jgi:diketogulonate reductase-like aldo/keto reductase
MLFDVMIL